MSNNKKIYYFRSRKTDYNLKPWDYRTYQGEYVGLFLLIFMAMVLFFNWVSSHLGGVSLYGLFKDAFLLEYDLKSSISLEARQKLFEVFLSSSLVGIFSSIKLVQPIQLTKISDVSEHIYYSDSKVATNEFHNVQKEKFVIDFKNQPKNSFYLVRPEECVGKPDFYKPIQINDNASILSMIVIGIAGAGKSAFLNRVYQEILNNKHKLIVHAPDSKARDMLVASGYSCYVSAPWTKSSIYIDLAQTLNVEDMNLKNALIDLVITSFFGYVDPSSPDAFFQNGAVYILTASLRKLCHLKSGKWTLEDWKEELISKAQIWEFKELVDTYYPEAGFTISEDAEKMTASIIASITKTVVEIGRLSMYYKQCRKAVDIRKWCLDEDKKQAIILCSDTQYEEVSKISIALFINLTIPFLLSSDREKVFNKNGTRIYQALDEFPNFARNIDTNKWVRIINEGRKFGNSASVIIQNTLQLVSCFNTKSPQADAKKFIGSFHTQVVAQPSNEEEQYLSSIVGEVTWDDKEAQQTIDQSTGKTSVSYQNKPRKEQINFKTLQTELGFVTETKKQDGTEIKIRHGLNVAIRLFETKLTAKLFFPFVNEFAKSNRDSFRDKIVLKDGKEWIKSKNVLTPLFYKEEKIVLTKNDENRLFIMNAISAKTRIMEGLDKDKHKERAILQGEIEELKLQMELGTEFESAEDDGFGEVISDIALHGLDHSGVTSIMKSGLEIVDAISSPDKGTGEVSINLVSEENKRPRLNLRKSKKQIELGD